MEDGCDEALEIECGGEANAAGHGHLSSASAHSAAGLGGRMLGQGMTLQQVADELDVHINSVEHWRQCWQRLGLVGLYEGRHSGRPPSMSSERQRELCRLAREEGG